jgi:hypothetical protein
MTGILRAVATDFHELPTSLSEKIRKNSVAPQELAVVEELTWQIFFTSEF